MLLLHQSMHSLVSQLIHLVSVSSFVPVEVYDGQELTALNALKQAKKKKNAHQVRKDQGICLVLAIITGFPALKSSLLWQEAGIRRGRGLKDCRIAGAFPLQISQLRVQNLAQTQKTQPTSFQKPPFPCACLLYYVFTCWVVKHLGSWLRQVSMSSLLSFLG